jgi:hypothetical protein
VASEATGRTKEGVPFSLTLKTATGAMRGSMSGIDQSQQDSPLGGISLDGRCQQTESPLRHPTPDPCSHSPFLLLGCLGNPQIFHDQHGILRTPLHQLFADRLAKGLGPISLLAAQPFEGTTHRTGVFAFCLFAGKLILKPSTLFSGLSIGNPVRNARDKQILTVRIYSDQDVGFIEVYPHRMNACGFWHFQRDADHPNQPAISLNDIDRINLFSLSQNGLKVFWHSVGNVFSACCRPDRKGSISVKAGISTPLTHQKQSISFAEAKRLLSRFLVSLGRSIGPSDGTNGRASHLSIQLTHDLSISCLMQIELAQRLAIIEAGLRKLLLDLLKYRQRIDQIRIWLNKDLKGLLYFHVSIIPLKTSTKKNSGTKKGDDASPSTQAKGY